MATLVSQALVGTKFSGVSVEQVHIPSLEINGYSDVSTASHMRLAVILTQGDDNVAAFTGIVDTFNFAMSFLQIPVSEPIIVGGLDAPGTSK
jgi:hypothetical protein